MKLLCVLHAAFEGLGVMGAWAKKKEHTITLVKPYRGEALPPVDAFDFLIVMGGPQSPLKQDYFPYLKDEIGLIGAFLEQDKGVIGFCLGAQLLGEACGARTERSPEKEVGVYPITLTKDGLQDPLLRELPQTFDVIHWHYDMPGLAPESVLLASSPGCPRQIVRYAPKAYGFQCHLEITQEGLALLADKAACDLTPSFYTQSKHALLSQPLTEIHQKMDQVLDRFVHLLEDDSFQVQKNKRTQG
ncbi:MAG: GMP synthase [Alphaproteobacteria bacterium]|nr:GMP synthase [Alphaproteobacteria bacterium]